MAWVAVVTDTAFAGGAQGGAKLVDDAAIDTAVDATKLNSAAAAFTTADAGKAVVVAGAGASGAPLKTTIASVSGGVATLSGAAQEDLRLAQRQGRPGRPRRVQRRGALTRQHRPR